MLHAKLEEDGFYLVDVLRKIQVTSEVFEDASMPRVFHCLLWCFDIVDILQ